ncbi:hypothetical protein GCM10023259_083340 [Thermocatellispora tengchongensis]
MDVTSGDDDGAGQRRTAFARKPVGTLAISIFVHKCLRAKVTATVRGAVRLGAGGAKPASTGAFRSDARHAR